MVSSVETTRPDPAVQAPRDTPATALGGPFARNDQRLVLIGDAIELDYRRVYRAYDQQLRREVHVELIDAGATTSTDEQTLRARKLAAFAHPGVRRVYDVEFDDAGTWLVIEPSRGERLHAWLRRSPRTWSQVADVFSQMAALLRAAHAAGLRHGQLSAESVWIESDTGRARLVDLSTATLVHGVREPADIDDLNALRTMLATILSGRRSRAITGKDDRDAIVDDLARPRGRPPAVLRREAAATTPADDAALALDRMAVALGRVAARRRGLRWPWAIAAGLIATTTAFVIVGRRESTPGPACEGVPTQLSATWNDARRVAITQRFRTHGPTWASALLDPVERSLDHYASAWTDVYQHACRASTLDHTFSQALLDRSMACLDERMAEFDAVVESLVEADAATIEKATQITDGLTPVAACGDDRYLTARVKPPADPGRAEAVVQLGADVAALRRFIHIGGYERAVAEIEALTTPIADTGHAPLMAELHFLRGLLELRYGERQRGRDLLHDVYLRSLESGDDELALRAAGDYAFSLAEHTADPSRAKWWIRHAQALLERGYHRPEVLAGFARSSGVVHLRAGDYELSLEQMTRAIELYADVFGDNHAAVVGAMINKAVLLTNLRDTAGARAMEAEALRRLKSSYGEYHPLACWLGYNSTQSQLVDAEYATALERVERLLPVCIDVLGPDHFMISIMQGSKASSLLHLGKLDTARAVANEIVENAQRTGDETDRDYAEAVAMLGRIELARNDVAAAVPLLRRAAAIYEATPSPTSQRSEAPTWFALAQAIADHHLVEARVFAVRARDYTRDDTEIGVAGRRLLVEIETWLADHPAPSGEPTPRPSLATMGG